MQPKRDEQSDRQCVPPGSILWYWTCSVLPTVPRKLCFGVILSHYPKLNVPSQFCFLFVPLTTGKRPPWVVTPLGSASDSFMVTTTSVDRAALFTLSKAPFYSF